MAEVNAFSIDGTKYALAATDQTYVGETGLAQLGLDYTCTPDELKGALTDAGGGVAILAGSSVEGDGWDLPHANGTVRMTSYGDTDYYRATLEWLGPTARDGTAVRMAAYGSVSPLSFEGADWRMTMYGYGDTWSSDTGVYLHGVVGSSGDVHCTLPVGPIAPGVSSASVSTLGTVYVYAGNESYHVTKSSKLSLTPDIGGGTVFIDVDDPGVGSTYDGATLMLGSGFVLKFS